MTPEQRTHTSLYERYRALTNPPLQFPLVGEENRPIRDAKGRLVSVTEHAPLFVAAANLAHLISRFNADGQDCEGEIAGEQAIDCVVKWITAANRIVEQK